MTDYVVGFMLEQLTERVVLVRKTKPAWQVGMLNGIGGKVEASDRTPLEAMEREWLEEMGYPHSRWRSIAVIRDERGAIHVFATEVRMFPELPDKIDSGELVETIFLRDLANRRDVISQMKWLLPLAFEDRGAPFVEAAA
jgi:8-oxo-dGTP diphosphatase